MTSAQAPAGPFQVTVQPSGRSFGVNPEEAILPAAGFASPSTYAINGKQYVVIACGGGKLKSPSGDKYVAFALK